MQQQRNSYEYMTQFIYIFLRVCEKTSPWASSVETLAGAVRVIAENSDCETESAALYEVAQWIESIAVLQERARSIMAGLPAHPHWPCEGCQRWTDLGCNRLTTGGFWD